MSSNQSVNLNGEPISMGIEIFSPISSAPGSSTFFITQPLLSGRVFASSAVLIGAEFILFIANRFFGINSIPILDINNQQTIQMPLSELQDFLRWMSNGSDPSSDLSTSLDGGNRLINSDRELVGVIGDRGFLTPETPEAPIVFAIYVLANYANKPFTPYVLLTVPIFTFPGLRGALPLLIIGLLATIFVRSVVPPETTGSKPLVKASTLTDQSVPLTFTPNDLVKLLNRFGKHFGSK